MNNESTLNHDGHRDRLGLTATDHDRQRSMTDDEINAAAVTDPDNPPLTPEQLAKFRRPHLAKLVRRQLRVDRATFAKTYGIPFETLKSWERYEAEPSPTEIAYLKLIERAPDLAKLQAAE